jgi:hypothetical protein
MGQPRSKLVLSFDTNLQVVKKMNLFQLILASAVLAAPAVQAQTVFDFANLTNGNSSNFLPTNGVNCTGDDKCSSDVSSVLNGTLSFASGGITVNATAAYGGSLFGTIAAVVQDHENGYNNTTGIGAGLGVYHQLNNNSDDNITVGEALKLSFNQAVTISAIGLRDDGHNTSFSSGTRFDYSFDNLNWTTANLTSSVALNHTGQDFYIRYGETNGAQFYLSSMTVTAVPEPETYAMLMAGLGVIGFMSRRRKARKA